MYLERMIAEAPVGKDYAYRPFDSVDELLLMIDEVLTMAPEFGQEMAATPLGAVLDWTMGITAGSIERSETGLSAVVDSDGQALPIPPGPAEATWVTPAR